MTVPITDGSPVRRPSPRSMWTNEKGLWLNGSVGKDSSDVNPRMARRFSHNHVRLDR